MNPVIKVYVLYNFRKNRLFPNFLHSFDQKIVPKMFSTKIILERKIFDFIENFSIRRVMKKCFFISIVNVSSVRKLCEFG